MNLKPTFILFLVAAALASFVYFYEIAGEGDRLADEEALSRVVVGVEPDEVAMLALTTTDGVAVAARRSDDGWRVFEPLDYPADPFVLDAMAATAISARWLSSVRPATGRHASRCGACSFCVRGPCSRRS